MYVSCVGLEPHLHEKLSHIVTFICSFSHFLHDGETQEKKSLIYLVNVCDCFDSFYLIFIA